MKKLRPPISPSKALGFVNTNCIAIDELQPDLLFLPILALKNTLQYKIQRRLHGQQSTNVIRFNFNLDLDYRQTEQDSRLLEERQWQCRENQDSWVMSGTGSISLGLVHKLSAWWMLQSCCKQVMRTNNSAGSIFCDSSRTKWCVLLSCYVGVEEAKPVPWSLQI